MYLGTMAVVADAEELGVMLAWEDADQVALDSQGDRAPGQLKWNRVALRGLTYLVTDKGPQRQWLEEMGKVDDPSCVCDGWTPQNAAHLMVCSWVGDGVGRSWEQAHEDEKWCAAIARFVE